MCGRFGALWLSGLVLGLGYGALGVWDVTLHLRKILEARVGV